MLKTHSQLGFFGFSNAKVLRFPQWNRFDGILKSRRTFVILTDLDWLINFQVGQHGGASSISHSLNLPYIFCFNWMSSHSFHPWIRYTHSLFYSKILLYFWKKRGQCKKFRFDNIFNQFFCCRFEYFFFGRKWKENVDYRFHNSIEFEI